MTNEPYNELEVEGSFDEEGNAKPNPRLTLKGKDGVRHSVPVTPALARKVSKLQESKGPRLLTEDNPMFQVLERDA